MTQFSHDNRRKFIGWLARLLMLAPLVAGASAELKPRPAVTICPFCPSQPVGLTFFGANALNPFPEGNDLTIGRGGKQSEGEKIRLSGRVMNTAGQGLPGILLEIWQVGVRGRYVVEKAAMPVRLSRVEGGLPAGTFDVVVPDA
jgi:hypothetical protein